MRDSNPSKEKTLETEARRSVLWPTQRRYAVMLSLADTLVSASKWQHIHHGKRLRTRGAIVPLLHIPSWRTLYI